MLEIKDLRVNLPDIRIKIDHLKLDRGDYLAVIGITGAGKTVFLETIAGFHKAERGKIIINGKLVNSLLPAERGIGIVYQDYMLFPHMTVKENIAFGLRFKKKESKGDIFVKKLMEELEIEHLAERYPGKLSGGEKQRVAIARALAIEPSILLLDEPFAALDIKTRENTKKLVKKIVEERNITTIHVTHNIEDVYDLANKILVMKNGIAVQFGPLDQVLYNPIDDYVASFFSNNLLKCHTVGNIEDATVLSCNGVRMITSYRAKGDVIASIRPEDIIISRSKIKTSARNLLKGKILNIELRGRLVWITVDVGIPLKVLLTPNSVEALGLREGEKIFVMFKASALHIIGSSGENLKE